MSYLVSGGTEAVVEALAEALGEQVVRVAPGARAAQAEAWLHLVPSEGESERELDLLLWALDEAFTGLPPASGGCFVAVVPVEGLYRGDDGLRYGIAAAAAKRLLRRRVGSWAERGLRLNVVEYGGFDLPARGSRRQESVLVGRTPMARLGTARELADVIGYVTSRAASFVTGSVLRVDGGWGAYSWFYPTREI